jgi:hypothetical protein
VEDSLLVVYAMWIDLQGWKVAPSSGAPPRRVLPPSRTGS